jgi:MFS family permease
MGMGEIIFALLNGLNLGVVIMNLPPVLSELMELYGVSYTQISVILSALLWPHAAMQLPAGMITDRLGIRRTQLVSLACMGLGNALPVVTPDLSWGVGGRMITGLGTGMGWLATLKLLAIAAGGPGPTRHSSPAASPSVASWHTWGCPSWSGPDGTGCT